MDSRDRLPIYYKIAQEIKDMIAANRLKPGDLIPSESELCRKYGVSRMTVRHALDELERELLIYRRRGIGTVVAAWKNTRDFDRLNSFHEEMLSRGLRPSSRLLLFEVVPAGSLLSQQLAVAEGAPVYHVRRLRLGNDEPIAIHDVYLSRELCPGLESYDLEQRSLYDIYETVYHYHPQLGRQRMEARLATRSQARLLSIREGDPLLYFQRVTYRENGQPLELVDAAYRADRYSFTVTLRR